MKTYKVIAAIMASNLSTRDRMVAVVVTMHDSGKGCWTSLAKLASEAGMSESGARRALDSLKSKQCLFITERPGRTTVYRIREDGLKGCQGDRGVRVTPPGVSGRHPRGVRVTPDLSKNRSVESIPPQPLPAGEGLTPGGQWVFKTFVRQYRAREAEGLGEEELLDAAAAGHVWLVDQIAGWMRKPPDPTWGTAPSGVRRREIVDALAVAAGVLRGNVVEFRRG